MIGYNLRFFSSLKYFRQLILDNYAGKVLLVHAEYGRYLPSWRPNQNYKSSVSARRDLGGGVLLELSHELDYLRWIFGEISWLKATTNIQSNLVLDVEDSANMFFGFKPSLGGGQLIGTLSIDFIRHDPTRKCIAIGEKGTLCWDGLLEQVAFYGEGSSGWKILKKVANDLEGSFLLSARPQLHHLWLP